MNVFKKIIVVVVLAGTMANGLNSMTYLHDVLGAAGSVAGVAGSVAGCVCRGSRRVAAGLLAAVAPAVPVVAQAQVQAPVPVAPQAYSRLNMIWRIAKKTWRVTKSPVTYWKTSILGLFFACVANGMICEILADEPDQQSLQMAFLWSLFTLACFGSILYRAWDDGAAAADGADAARAAAERDRAAAADNAAALAEMDAADDDAVLVEMDAAVAAFVAARHHQR